VGRQLDPDPVARASAHPESLIGWYGLHRNVASGRHPAHRTHHRTHPGGGQRRGPVDGQRGRWRRARSGRGGHRREREPITDANRDAAYSGGDITEEEHEITLRAERPVVSTEAEPVERVRLGTETVTGTETVSGQVRKEQVELDDPTGTARDR
jgi:hypothetical protein